MSLFYGLFSLDTLDKRLTTPSKAPVPSRTEADPGKPQRRTSGDTQPSLWHTPEFYLYYVVFIVIVPLMFKAVYDVSQSSHPNYKNFEKLLSPGWIPGRLVDNSDGQYSGFRGNIPYLAILLVVQPLLRNIWNSVFPAKKQAARDPSVPATGLRYSPEADARLEQRVGYDLVFALIYLAALHGFSALKVLIIITINYQIAKKLPRDSVVPLTWLFNIVVLFANELCRGYPYSDIALNTFPWTVQDPNSNWGTFMDHYGGLMPRWEILFNITVLRLISFNMDYHWSRGRSQDQIQYLEKKQLDPSNLSDRDRVDISARTEDYSYRNYLAYALYAPLYLTGPILTFNEYLSQQRYAPKTIDITRVVRYGIRFIACLLCMEIMLHYMYAVAISKASPAWEIYSPFQISMLGYFNLHIIWLKLLLPWRFFRLWALVDGIDPPENMVRCMSDNYSALAFWRGWHRSYNRWIVRYLYVPLGGSGQRGVFGVVRACVNYLLVFTFVALWHDIQLRLLMWGWLVSLFVLPEVLAHMVFPKRNFVNRPTQYRMIFGAVSVLLILMMMAANLVGFALGLDGLQAMLNALFASFSGVLFLIAACLTLFVGVQVMFEHRQEEIRHGIVLKY